MSQKFNITYDSPTIITINGKWKQNSYLHVTYSWSGEPDSVTLPVDDTNYIPENSVTVNTTYVANQIVDDYKGTIYYQFSGWDKSDFNITADTTISGTWTSIPYSFVKYDWDNPLVTNTLPVDNTYYHQNDLVTVDDRASGSIKLYDKWAESNEIMKMTNGPSNNCVCYSEDLDRFVCVFSETKEALYSNDGITWNASTISSTERNWYSVCYGNGKFVAVANKRYSAYSTDGKNWTESTISNANRTWSSVCYGNGKFIAVAQDTNYFAYSNDGINWTESTISDTSRDWQSVCYGNGEFVVMGNSKYFAYSNDGINWTENSFNIDIMQWSSVCYGNGKFVAVATNGFFSYSSNGINWIAGDMSNIRSWKSVCYGNGKYVAVASDGYSAYSNDGMTWTESTISNTSRQWNSVCYGNGEYVAVSINDTNAVSTDGINWNEYHNLSFYDWRSVCYGNGMYIAIASNSQMFAFSFDGINWIEGMISNTSRTWSSVCYGNDKFVAVTGADAKSNYFAYSNDGMTWTESTISNTSRNWRSVCYGNGKFVAVAQTSYYFAYSNDGITWTEGDMPNNRQWHSVCYGNDKFVAVAYNSNYFAYSNDGMTWTESKVSSNNRRWTSVCYGNGKFVAVVTNDSYFAYSNDGITWTEGSMPNEYWYSVCYGDGKFVAVSRSKRVGEGCYFAYSNDGITWRQAIVPNSNYFYSVCYGNGKFVAVAEYMSTHFYLDHINYTEFSAWDHTNFNITSDTTIKALWETKNKLKVEYSWSGAPSSLTSVPPDTSYYMPNANVTVDSYYDENCVCTSDSGYYQFSGWNKENFNITEDTSITGSWSLISTPVINTGDTFLFGKYQVESEDPWEIEWEVVDDTNNDYIIAQTKSIIDLRSFDAMEPNNTDSNRKNYGNNNWQYSNIEQYLNSDQESWYSAQHQYDAPPTSDNVSYNPYDTHKGFLYYFTDSEKSYLQDMTLTLANNTITDGGGSYTWTGKVWLPTYTQMSGKVNNSIMEGTLFNKYTDDNSSRIKYIHEKCAQYNQYCIDRGYTSNDTCSYWMSSASPSYSHSVRNVRNVGDPGYVDIAYSGAYGLAPCIKIRRSDLAGIILAKDHKIIN